MTDIHAPSTGSQPAPMFDTGPLPAQSPHTEPSEAPIFDTGPHPGPLQSLGSPYGAGPPSISQPQSVLPQAFSELDTVDTVDTDAFLRSVTGHLRPVSVSAQPVAVAGSYQFVKRWKFALIVAGVWLLGAAAGLGSYYWWYTALDKTLPVLGILMYLVVCMVASILVSMVPNRPQVTALAVALMAAPLASTAAAAVLHGAYFFEWIARPVVG